MIWDCFMYAGERQMVEIRLTELAHIPDIAHVAIQGDRTFRGNPREVTPVGWASVRDIALRLPAEATAWEREAFQRDASRWVLDGRAQPDDVIIISDVDEIPRARVVCDLPFHLRRAEEPLALEMRMHYFSARWQAPRPWYHPKAATIRQLDDQYGGSPEALRNADPPAIPNAGWHLTYFMSEPEIHAKLQAFSHAEYDTPEWHEQVRDWMEQGTNMHGEELLVYEGDDWPLGFRP